MEAASPSPDGPSPAPAPPAEAAAPAASLECPACRAAVPLRAPAHSLTAVCPACGAVFDPRDPGARPLPQAGWAGRMEPLIPLGARGTLRGQPYDVVGFLIHEGRGDEAVFAWDEYVLLGADGHYRFLTAYQGHWILAKYPAGRPRKGPRRGGHETVVYLGATYRHFQTAEAEVVHCEGEFPWQVAPGRRITVEDYIDPPRILSCERAGDERTWTVGEHLEGEALWKAFRLPGHPPPRRGVGAVQPSPFRGQWPRVRRLAAVFLAAAVLLHLGVVAASQNRLVLEAPFAYERGRGENARVTEPFELTGRRSNVLVEIRTDLANAWAYFNLALVNEGTGRALNFGREVSYYFGREGGESWTEGRPGDSVYLPAVEPGRYYLLVDPETRVPRLNYTIRLWRDVPRSGFLVWALALLGGPPLVFWLRGHWFEHRRWSESDHPLRLAGATPGDAA